MSDQSFHEIQLSGKQLVFLFMCAVVLTVVVFLFGVSVGREVRSPSAQTALTSVSAPTDTNVPAEAPPPTQPAPNELSYAQALQGRDGEDPSKVTPPAPAPEEPRGTVPVQKSAPPPVSPPAKKTDTVPPSSPPAAKKTEMAPAAAKTETPPPPAPVTTPLAARNSRPQDPPSKAVPALGGFFVQVEAFSANDIAAKEVTKLQGKGYPAFVFTEAENTPGPRYKVRVGPYSARAQADQMRKSLIKEGYHPLIKR